jgi:hypothetical protein
MNLPPNGELRESHAGQSEYLHLGCRQPFGHGQLRRGDVRCSGARGRKERQRNVHRVYLRTDRGEAGNGKWADIGKGPYHAARRGKSNLQFFGTGVLSSLRLAGRCKAYFDPIADSVFQFGLRPVWRAICHIWKRGPFIYRSGAGHGGQSL